MRPLLASVGGSALTPVVLLGGLLAVLVWGASPVATKVAVTHLSPLAVMVLRTTLAAVFALPLVIVLGIGLPRDRGQRLLLLLSAFCGFIGFPLVFNLGQQLTSVAHAALILAVLPVFTGAIAMAWDRRWPPLAWWLGCFVALLGEVVLVAGRSGLTGTGASVTGDLVVLLSGVLASLGYVVGGRLQQAGYSSLGATFWGVVVATVVLLPVLPWVLVQTDWPQVPVQAWAGVGYLVAGSTIVGYVLWYWALGRGGIARIGLLQFLQPVTGVLLAAALLGEALTPDLLLASALILGGVALARRGG